MRDVEPTTAVPPAFRSHHVAAGDRPLRAKRKRRTASFESMGAVGRAPW
jgi:hypothetical protein